MTMLPNDVQLAGSLREVEAIASGTPIARQPIPALQGTSRLRVSAAQQAERLISGAPAAYPPLARQARIQGVARLQVVVGADGKVKNVQVMSAHPMLAMPAMEAVRTYLYKPTLLNGQAVEVETTVDVNFTLQQ